VKPITLRIPEKLHERLKKYASQERRSINNQIIIILEKFLSRTNGKEDKDK